MGCLICKSHVFNSCFKITVHKHEEKEEGYLQLLEIDRSKNETVFIVHKFSDNNQSGFFMECLLKEEALGLYLMLLDHFYKEEILKLNEDRRRVRKLVIYKDTHRPWFFHPTNKYLLTDTFVPSFS